MPELLVLLAFLSLIALCAGMHASILPALAGGFLLFFGYGLFRRIPARELLLHARRSMKPAAGIIVVMGLIGMLTGSWRASGTVARLVTDAAGFISPEWSLLAAFLLNGVLSTLIGTSFGTAATLGVVSMMLMNAMGVPPVLAGGAVLAGIYVGDRCSPVSTSAALVAVVTGTRLADNIRTMLRTGAVPLAAASAVLGVIGSRLPVVASDLDVSGLFSPVFSPAPATLLPAAVLFVLMLFRTGVRTAMAASILSAAGVALFVQDAAPAAVARSLLLGYASPDERIAAMVNGGGLVSMLPVCGVILISSTYAGLLERTGLIAGITRRLESLARRISPTGALVVTAVTTCLTCCNQVLAVMLTNDICRRIRPDPSVRAAELENTAIVIAPLVPWSIAGSVPIATIGAPDECIAAAFYLWMLPAWTLFSGWRAWRRGGGDVPPARTP